MNWLRLDAFPSCLPSVARPLVANAGNAGNLGFDAQRPLR